MWALCHAGVRPQPPAPPTPALTRDERAAAWGALGSASGGVTALKLELTGWSGQFVERQRYVMLEIVHRSQVQAAGPNRARPDRQPACPARPDARAWSTSVRCRPCHRAGRAGPAPRNADRPLYHREGVEARRHRARPPAARSPEALLLSRSCRRQPRLGLSADAARYSHVEGAGCPGRTCRDRAV